MTHKIEINKINCIIRRDKWIYMSFLFVFFIYFTYSLLKNGTIDVPGIYIKTIYLVCTITLLISSTAYLIYLISVREKRPLIKFLDLIKTPFKMWEESINIALIITLIALTLSMYTDVKESIPDNINYYLDPYLIKIDNALHFGITPWKITHYLFSSPISSAVINLFYNLWFFICWIFLITFCFLYKNPSLRERTLISFLLCWTINGGIAATAFASVGPCFYDLFNEGSNQFIDLMQTLNQQNIYLDQEGFFLKVWALNTQNILWESYVTQSSEFGGGISAMPSMHVSMATLMALATYSWRKWLGIIFWVYMLIIMIGSVHLGWHYAVDGYIGSLMTIVIWLVVSRFTFKNPKQKDLI